jgi:hypothetical protein
MFSIYKGFPTFGLCSVYTGFQFIQGPIETTYQDGHTARANSLKNVVCILSH